MPYTILRLPAVKARTGLSRSTIYLRIAEDRFPRPVSLGSNTVGWIDGEIDTWIGELVIKRNASARRRQEETP